MPKRRREASGTFYEFGKDATWSFQGYELADHKPRIRKAFRWTVLVFIVVETLLAAWPIAATSVWSVEAVLTWIWFLYVPRVLFLLWALVATSEVITLFGAGNKTKGNFLRTVGAFAPSNTLAVWTVFAWVGGTITGCVFVVLSAVAWVFLDSTLLAVLAVVIGVAGVLESIAAPFCIYRFGVFIPILRAHNTEKKKGKRTSRASPPKVSQFSPVAPAASRDSGRLERGHSNLPNNYALTSHGGLVHSGLSSNRSHESKTRLNRGVIKNKHFRKSNRAPRPRNRGI